MTRPTFLRTTQIELRWVMGAVSGRVKEGVCVCHPALQTRSRQDRSLKDL